MILPTRHHAVSRVEAFSDLVSAAVGAFATILALSTPGYLASLSGFSYFLMGPAHWLYGRSMSRRRKRYLLMADS